MFLFFYQVFEKTVFKKLTFYYTKIKFVIFLTKFIIPKLCVEYLFEMLTFREYHYFRYKIKKIRPHFSKIGAIILLLTIGVKGELSIITVTKRNFVDVYLIQLYIHFLLLYPFTADVIFIIYRVTKAV